MNRILLTFWMLFCTLPGFAEKFSYLYIQGDQKTPFYVKLDDAMQPRYGKNYCIIPKLVPGPIHIEVLFQQNIYPAQQFNIQIPEDGSRGFLLVMGKDSSFQLYDLQQGFYLKAGNEISEDRVPAKTAAVAIPAAAVPAAVPAKTSKKSTSKPPKASSKKQSAANQATVPAAPATPGAPVFMNMELSHDVPPKSDTNVAVVEDPVTSNTTKVAACSKALTSEEFEPIFNKFSSRSGDEDKLEYFYTQLDACYESWQARALTERLQGDAAKFDLLKKLYPRITDRKAFQLLDDTLNDAAWKAEFAKLIHQ